MADIPKPETPELDRERAVADDAQIIGEFLEWLEEEKIHLIVYRDATDWTSCWCTIQSIDGEANPKCSDCHGKGTYQITCKDEPMPDGRSIQKLLADYFKIDLNKTEAERRELLKYIRQLP